MVICMLLMVSKIHNCCAFLKVLCLVFSFSNICLVYEITKSSISLFTVTRHLLHSSPVTRANFIYDDVQ